MSNIVQLMNRLLIPDTIMQIGTSNNVDHFIRFGDSFDWEEYLSSHQNSNLYFLGGTNQAVNTRAKDGDVIKKNYIVIDFDIRKTEEEKPPNSLCDDQSLLQIATEIRKRLDGNPRFRDYSYIINSGNGIHVYFLGNFIDIDGKGKIFKTGAQQILTAIETVAQYPTDHACVNPARLFRLPGSFNNKNIGNPKAVEFLAIKECVSTLLDEVMSLGEAELAQSAKKQIVILDNLTGTDKDTYSAINSIPISEIVCKLFSGWEFDGQYHFVERNTTKQKACFVAKDGNYIVHGGTDHFPDTQKGYSPFTFVKMKLELDNAGTFEWFKKNYPELKTDSFHLIDSEHNSVENVLVSKEDTYNEFYRLLEAIPTDLSHSQLPLKLDHILEIIASLNEAEAYALLSGDIKKRFDVSIDLIKALVKTVKDKRKRQKWMQTHKPVEEKIKPELNPEEVAAAEKKLLSKTLLYDILGAIKSLGVVGEEANALVIYLVLTSRVLPRPLSLVVKGESSSGKSFPITQVLKMMPEDAYCSFTDMTAQSMYYGTKDAYKHKTIVVFERHGSEKADYPIRSFMSEGVLKIQTTIKNPDTNEFEAQTKEIEGPIGIIETTTAPTIHAENETRVLNIFTDQTVAQTERVLAGINGGYLGKHVPSELVEWQHVQSILKPYHVRIPFCEVISNNFSEETKKIVRLRRDYTKLLSVIESCAILHQRQRVIKSDERGEYLEATLADYFIAKAIIEAPLIKTMLGVPEQTRLLLEATIKLAEDTFTFSVDGEQRLGQFTEQDIANKLGWSKSTVNKWIDPLKDNGYILVEEEAVGRKAAKYRLNPNKKYEELSLFPAVEAIVSQFPNVADERIYDPLTGLAVNMPCNDVTMAKNNKKNVSPEWMEDQNPESLSLPSF